MDYTEMLEFVEKYLLSKDALIDRRFPFRNRFEHSKRVYQWCLRLLPDCPNCDKNVVLTAAIFHDIGYGVSKINHAEESAEIFRDYAESHHFDDTFIDKTAQIISLHSYKERLKECLQEELILLMEADLLDEEGALGIVWDLLAEGENRPQSYHRALEVIEQHSAHILSQDYMVTPLAKKFWEEKQDVVKRYIKEMKKDLFIEEE